MATVVHVTYRPQQTRTRPEHAAAAAVLLVVTGLLQVLDALSTVIGLRLGGEEANHLSDLVLQAWGTTGFLLLKAVFGVLLVGLALHIWRARLVPAYVVWGSIGLCVGMLAVVSINMLQIAMALGL